MHYVTLVKGRCILLHIVLPRAMDFTYLRFYGDLLMMHNDNMEAIDRIVLATSMHAEELN